jgi:hypothetical protein
MFIKDKCLWLTRNLVIEVLLGTIEAMVSDHLRTRLARCESVLVLLERRRAESGNPDLGWHLERKLMDFELADLETATAAQESTEHVRPARTDTLSNG